MVITDGEYSDVFVTDGNGTDGGLAVQLSRSRTEVRFWIGNKSIDVERADVRKFGQALLDLADKMHDH